MKGDTYMGLKYDGNSKVVAGITVVGNTVIALAKILVPAAGVAMLFYGPQILPWYKK